MQRHTGEELVLKEGVITCREVRMAKHVFTHKIWEMHLWCLTVTPQFDLLPEWRMVSIDQLDELPFPSAMKAAMQEARKLMEDAG
jgi:adenine-specific DNA glycosylase